VSWRLSCLHTDGRMVWIVVSFSCNSTIVELIVWRLSWPWISVSNPFSSYSSAMDGRTDVLKSSSTCGDFSLLTTVQLKSSFDLLSLLKSSYSSATTDGRMDDPSSILYSHGWMVWRAMALLTLQMRLLSLGP